MLAGLGRTFEITRTAIKPHAACRHSQAAIDATIGLATAHDLSPADVERIGVRIFKGALASVAEPAERKRRPQSLADAQFNIFFAVAGALTWRGIEIGHYRPENYRAPDMLALIDRIACVSDPALDGLFPRLWPAEVELLLRDGRRVGARIDHPLGDPENPLSDQLLRAKFDGLAASLLPLEKRQALLAAVDVFADRPVRSFTRLLSSDP
jgi:2-methylcitrate dehydratase PrpD